jgi:hypothetical protein
MESRSASKPIRLSTSSQNGDWIHGRSRKANKADDNQETRSICESPAHSVTNDRTKAEIKGDIDKAFGVANLDPPKQTRSMAATVEDEEEEEVKPRPRARVVRKGSPINSIAERYGEAYA